MTNAQYGCGFDPAIDRFGFAVHQPGFLSGLLPRDGLCVLAGPGQPGAGVEHPDAMAADLLDAPRCGAVACSNSSPMATPRSPQGQEQTFSTQLSIPVPIPVSSGVSLPALVTVAPPNQFVSDGGVVYAFSNIPFAFIGAADTERRRDLRHGRPGHLHLRACGSRASRSSSRTPPARPADFTPNLTPVYALTDLDFVDEKGNKDPVQVERVDVFSLPTIQRVEVLSRGNQYSARPGRGARPKPDRDFRPARRLDHSGARDLRRIRNGAARSRRRSCSASSTSEPSSPSSCPGNIACSIPMDIVTITDANLGLSNYPVRIIEIEEDDKGLLVIHLRGAW